MKYFKIIIDIRGRELRNMVRYLYYSDAEKASAAYHIMDDMLQNMYENEMILNYNINMGITEDIK